MTGLPEAARRILGRNVRIGRPLGVAGLPEAAKGPAFSAAVGLLIYPQVADIETQSRAEAALMPRMTGLAAPSARIESVVQGQLLVHERGQQPIARPRRRAA